MRYSSCLRKYHILVGELSVIKALDFETIQYYTLNLTLTDDAGLSTTEEVNVTIVDENEPPVFTQQSINLNVQEERVTLNLFKSIYGAIEARSSLRLE